VFGCNSDVCFCLIFNFFRLLRFLFVTFAHGRKTVCDLDQVALESAQEAAEDYDINGDRNRRGNLLGHTSRRSSESWSKGKRPERKRWVRVGQGRIKWAILSAVGRSQIPSVRAMFFTSVANCVSFSYPSLDNKSTLQRVAGAVSLTRMGSRGMAGGSSTCVAAS
jgi:hypothetical protein